MKKSKDSTGGSGRNDDEKLWDFVIRTVTPLSQKNRVRKEQALRGAVPAKSAPPVTPLPERFPDFGLKPAPAGEQTPGHTDRRTAGRLRRGEIPFERVLDLHGLRQGEAQQYLFRFLQQSAQSGCRCVLVITGKGRDAGGTLKNALPLWIGLPAVSGLILDFSPARPRDGGDGAFYILLRRQR